MFDSVRGRITLVATLVVAAAMLLASVLIVRMVESDLIEATERALAAELELQAAVFDVGAAVIDPNAPPQFFEVAPNGAVYGFGVFLEDGGDALGTIIEPGSGIPVADVVISTADGQLNEILDPFTGEAVTDDVLIGIVEGLAFGFEDLDGPEGNLLLVGAVARDEVDQSLEAVRRALLLIVPALTVLMGVLIWWLVGRALRPVQAISTRVEAITTSRLHERVPVPRGKDEISGLARVMNLMLGRLERGDSRQKQFAADASHELRSPLAAVRAAAELIEVGSNSERVPALAADIVAEADRMDALIGDLLTLSQVDEDRTIRGHVPVDLSAMIVEHATGDVRVEPGIVVHGDAAQLRRVLENLVRNAQRHAASTVRTSADIVEHDGVRVAELCVEDDGDGVPVDLRDVIFERFSRLDEARSRDEGGTGLGLALVETIVRRHRGTVAVDDSPALGGARFTVQLPAASP